MDSITVNNEAAATETTTPLCVVRPLSSHQATVVFLHGRGSSGEEFRDQFVESAQGSDGRTLPQRFPGIKWVLPSAPERFSTVFQMEISEWFDVYSLSNPAEREGLQVQGLRESIEQVHEVLRQEVAVVGASRVVLAGISQGCAVGLLALLSFDQALGGFIGLSGWCPFRAQLNEVVERYVRSGSLDPLDGLYSNALQLTCKANKATLATPAFIGYALDDGTVEPELSAQLADTVERFGMPLQTKTYQDCGHWIKEPEGVDDMATFLGTTLTLVGRESRKESRLE